MSFAGRIPSKEKFEGLYSEDLDVVHSYKLVKTFDDNLHEMWSCEKCAKGHNMVIFKGTFDPIKHNNLPYENKFSCNYCSKSFSTDAERRQHGFIHQSRAR